MSVSKPGAGIMKGSLASICRGIRASGAKRCSLCITAISLSLARGIQSTPLGCTLVSMKSVSPVLSISVSLSVPASCTSICISGLSAQKLAITEGSHATERLFSAPILSLPVWAFFSASARLKSASMAASALRTCSISASPFWVSRTPFLPRMRSCIPSSSSRVFII